MEGGLCRAFPLLPFEWEEGDLLRQRRCRTFPPTTHHCPSSSLHKCATFLRLPFPALNPKPNFPACPAQAEIEGGLRRAFPLLAFEREEGDLLRQRRCRACLQVTSRMRALPPLTEAQRADAQRLDAGRCEQVCDSVGKGVWGGVQSLSQPSSDVPYASAAAADCSGACRHSTPGRRQV